MYMYYIYTHVHIIITKAIHKNCVVVDKDLGSGVAILQMGKTVDDFNTLDKSYKFTLNLSATRELQYNNNTAKKTRQMTLKQD